MKCVLIALLFLLNYNLATKVRYDNYALYELIPKNQEVIDRLKETEVIKKCKFWSPSIKQSNPVLDIMVPPNFKDDFEKVLKSLDIEYRIKMNNIQDYIDRTEFRKNDSETFGWDAYYNLDEIYTWQYSLTTQYPDKVQSILAGQTYEIRNIVGVNISFNADNVNRGVFIESNIHAREWISSAVSTYILNEVLTNQDADFRKVVESFNWYFVPVANPDGFEYSHVTDRLWRKTRQPYAICHGADPNRNWDFHWNHDGSSKDPCSESYAGSKVFSEPETASLSEYLSGIADNLVAYISFHSYSQLLMVPFGNTTDHLDNYDVTYTLAVKAIEALATRYGTQYKAGNIAEAIYLATGTSIDWVKEKLQIPYVYVYELRDTGNYGFLLPPEQILPTAEETLDSLIVILKGILESTETNTNSNFRVY